MPVHCKLAIPSVWTKVHQNRGLGKGLFRKHNSHEFFHEQRQEMDARHGKEELTLKEISKHFNTPIQDAAKALGVCPTILKKVCRRLGIVRWPYRRVNSLNKMIATLETAYQRQHEQSTDGSPPRTGTRGTDTIRREIEALKRERDNAMTGNTETCKAESEEDSSRETERPRRLPLHHILLPTETETSSPPPKKTRLPSPPVEVQTTQTREDDSSPSPSLATNAVLPSTSPSPINLTTDELQPQNCFPLPAKWHHELTDPSTGSTKTVVLLPPLETIS